MRLGLSSKLGHRGPAAPIPTCPSPKVRHEVASITVKPAFAGLHPLFHQRFPTGTGGIGNDPVRSCRDNVASSLWMATEPRGFDRDCQPQDGRELGTDRMVKETESPPTRRHKENSVRG